MKKRPPYINTGMTGIDDIAFKCKWCGNWHLHRKDIYKRSPNHFCSISCASKYRMYVYHKDNGIDINELVECECGCGRFMKKYVRSGKNYRKARFIYGHQAKGVYVGRFKKGCESINKGVPMPEHVKEILRKANLGSKRSTQARINMSCGRRGIKVENFDKFITEDYARHNYHEKQKHEDWRDKIFKRDNYTCQICGKRGCTLNAHHIKSWNDFPELRRELSNGITLCKSCHYYVHSKKFKAMLERIEV